MKSKQNDMNATSGAGVGVSRTPGVCQTPTERVMSVSRSPVQANTFGRPVRTCAPHVSVCLYKRLSYVNRHCYSSWCICHILQFPKTLADVNELDIKISITGFNIIL